MELETERMVLDHEAQRRAEKLQRRIEDREDLKIKYAHEERMRELDDAREARINELKIKALEAIIRAREVGVDLTDVSLLSRLIEDSGQHSNPGEDV
ncbi:MAG TPA: hypothetical protein VHG28_23810 [Longimicrobiaceae bacterium]|nr:hypothetical protein [Longimicrobiaceae bacterium]